VPVPPLPPALLPDVPAVLEPPVPARGALPPVVEVVPALALLPPLAGEPVPAEPRAPPLLELEPASPLPEPPVAPFIPPEPPSPAPPRPLAPGEVPAPPGLGSLAPSLHANAKARAHQDASSGAVARVIGYRMGSSCLCNARPRAVDHEKRPYKSARTLDFTSRPLSRRRER
jgi:hypothetical protein